jgi:hypothetical protein
VKAHADADRAVCQRLLSGFGCGECFATRPEGDKEGIALGVDLDATIAAAGLAHDPPVLAKRYGVGIRTEFVEKARRALDVRE